MLTMILRRLLIAVPTILVIIVVSFLIIKLAPGSPFDSLADLDPQQLANLEAAYNLDKPVLVQFWLYFSGLLQGDMGQSFVFRDRTVSEIIVQGFPVSAQIGLSAVAVGTSLGIALGLMAALRKNSAVDYGVMSLTMFGVAVPTFVTAPLMVLLFGLTLGWLPIAGWQGGDIRHMILPVAALALPKAGIVARITRGSMLEVLRANHVRTARSKGLPERLVIWRHTLRAGLMPVVSYLGPAIATVMTGSVVIEQIFGLPGIGRSFIEGAVNRDYPVVMGITILYAALIILMNLLVDIAYRFLDPRAEQAS
ncbi:ABC transporter permease [Brevundimonas faecalis]|uniref:Oligopeptide transport system permease protein n=1 Tax=Brevundimonas faecalis TaxID=947378 RepID=A0ABV2R9T9_9CAUL